MTAGIANGSGARDSIGVLEPTQPRGAFRYRLDDGSVPPRDVVAAWPHAERALRVPAGLLRAWRPHDFVLRPAVDWNPAQHPSSLDFMAQCNPRGLQLPRGLDDGSLSRRALGRALVEALPQPIAALFGGLALHPTETLTTFDDPMVTYLSAADLDEAPLLELYMTLIHEAGHCLLRRMSAHALRVGLPVEELLAAWAAAIDRDPGASTPYGVLNIGEDISEALVILVMARFDDALRTRAQMLIPARLQLLQTWLQQLHAA